jgi:hypothetical protein
VIDVAESINKQNNSGRNPDLRSSFRRKWLSI